MSRATWPELQRPTKSFARLIAARRYVRPESVNSASGDWALFTVARSCWYIQGMYRPAGSASRVASTSAGGLRVHRQSETAFEVGMMRLLRTSHGRYSYTPMCVLCALLSRGSTRATWIGPTTSSGAPRRGYVQPSSLARSFEGRSQDWRRGIAPESRSRSRARTPLNRATGPELQRPMKSCANFVAARRLGCQTPGVLRNRQDVSALQDQPG